MEKLHLLCRQYGLESKGVSTAFIDVMKSQPWTGNVRKLINLWGKVIPVIDLRMRFGMAAVDYTERTCNIVVEVGRQNGTVQIGLVVDAVSEVLNIKQEDIEDAPTFGAAIQTDYILGMAKMEGGVKILLDIDRVLSENEKLAMERIGK